MSVYQCQITEQNSWLQHPDGTTSAVVEKHCHRRHRTISGALRCLRGLQVYHKDGTHNDWAHFGDIREITDGHSRPLCDDDAETLDALMRAGR